MSKFVRDEAAFVSLVAPGGLVNRAVAKAAGATRDRARRNAPVDNGRLRQSINSQQVAQTASSVTYRVGTDVGYARYQEEGTGIYGPKGRPILPRRAKVLRFIPKSNRGTAVPFSPFVYAASVKGSRPHWFLKKAIAMLSLRDFS